MGLDDKEIEADRHGDDRLVNDDDAFARSTEPGIWRRGHADRARVVVDAADYYDAIQQVMMKAQKRIFLIGWDFDSRIALSDGHDRWSDLPKRQRPPRRLGAFIVWLVNRNPELQVYILKWNFGALKTFLRGSMMLDMVRWFRHPRIDFKFDSAHPFGCSHHQKIVIVDDRFGVCGGIDMTADRWDTREHRDDQPLRREPGGKPYGPWHDVTMLVEGEAARALDDLGRNRWNLAGGCDLDPVPPQPHSVWPDRLAHTFENVEVGIARTRSGWNDHAEIREIEALFIEMIGRAKRFIYAESQYFASRKIGEAIAARMAEPDPPEIVLVNPETADGWLEQQAMDTARVRLLQAIGKVDVDNRFRIYIPRTARGEAIYVHAKLMIVDDEVLRIGSANMNNRSLGLDSECDMIIDMAREANAHVGPEIRKLRLSLLAEHTGIDEDEIEGLLESYGSMHALIEKHPQPGRSLRAFKLSELTDAQKALADGEVLDPESADEMFEPLSQRRGLLRRFRGRWSMIRHARRERRLRRMKPRQPC